MVKHTEVEEEADVCRGGTGTKYGMLNKNKTEIDVLI